MGDWQPIETAPKDGTEVLIYARARYVSKWVEDANFGYGGDDDGPGWQLWLVDGDEWYSCATRAATHWMPLPDPPKETKQNA